MEFPLFINIYKNESDTNKCCLRLMSFNKKTARYYRDGGQWNATVKIRGEKMSGKINYTGTKINAIECTYDECTYDEWRENNGPYGHGITKDYTLKDSEDTPSDNELPF